MKNIEITAEESIYHTNQRYLTRVYNFIDLVQAGFSFSGDEGQSMISSVKEAYEYLEQYVNGPRNSCEIQGRSKT